MESQQGGLGGAASTTTPTTLPHMSVVPPVASQEPRTTGSGLPRRQPGAAGGPGSTPPRPAWANAASQSDTTPSASAPSAASAPGDTSSGDLPSESTSAQTPAPPVESHSPAGQHEPIDEPVRVSEPPSIRDLAPAPVAETPIFRQLQTSWLSDSDSADLPWASEEIDQGWQAAERAAAGESVGRSRSGLPMRRPGSTLVPGQAGQRWQRCRGPRPRGDPSSPQPPPRRSAAWARQHGHWRHRRHERIPVRGQLRINHAG